VCKELRDILMDK